MALPQVIDFLQDKDGENIILPKTVTEAIYDADGNRLDNILANTVTAEDDEIVEDEIAIVDSDKLNGKTPDYYATAQSVSDLNAELMQTSGVVVANKIYWSRFGKVVNVSCYNVSAYDSLDLPKPKNAYVVAPLSYGITAMGYIQYLQGKWSIVKESSDSRNMFGSIVYIAE